MTFIEQFALAFGGYAFHVLKLWFEATKRNEEFINKSFLISIPMNLVAIVLLVYAGNSLPPDLIVMSPLTCIMMGGFGSSMLAGFINVKKPKSLPTDDV